MKGSKVLFGIFCVLTIWMTVLMAWARPVPQGLWEFNDPENLLQASAGEPLLLLGDHMPTSGISDGDGAVTIGVGSYYQCLHRFAENGGGVNVNEYTVVMDLHLDSLSRLNALIQPDPSNEEDAAFFIDTKGHIGGEGTGYSTEEVPENEWFRVAIVVNLVETAGAVDIYVNGTSFLHAEPSFWDALRGAADIHQDGPFSLASADSSTPWLLFFADNDGGDEEVTVSSIAIYDHALLSEEVADLGGPSNSFLLLDVPGATSVNYDGFRYLSAGHYDTILVGGITNLTGELRLEDVVMNTPGSVSSISEGYFNFIGQMLRVQNFATTGTGYRASCLFQMPGFLGGISEGVDFVFDGNTCTIDGGHFELPNIDQDGLQIKNVYLDVHPDTGSYGGGGQLQLPTWGQGIKASIALEAGLGPEIAGVRLPDVTEIGLDVTGLNIPVGEIFTLYSIGGGISNPFGLSDPLNWGNSTLSADMRLVIEPTFNIGGRTYFLFSINADGSFSLQDGSLTIDGTGLLMNTIETNTVHAHYDPPYYFDVGATFNALEIFKGSIDAGVSPSGFHGDLYGTLGIPAGVPVVGGWTFADAQAHISNLEFEGALDVVLIPAIPSICTPQVCFPPLCIGWFSCDSTCWAWIFPYPCNCHWNTACWTPPCIPPICTPAIPPVKVHFGFRFVATTGEFDWEKAGPFNPWEHPIEAPVKTGEQNGAFYVLTNFWTAASVSTQPVRSTQKSLAVHKDGKQQADLYIGQDVPAALFRLNYENTAATKVDMTIETPNGTILHSADGALPMGFDNHVGYSRFNSNAQEQVIALLDPIQGAYTVTVSNADEIGNYTVDLLLQDALPSGEITAVTPGEEAGEYRIEWSANDPEGATEVRLFLDHDRSGSDGFLVATVHESSNAGAYTLDSSALNVHAGDYFVRLEVDDGVNAPFSFHSDDTIQVVPTGAPEPVSGIQFLPDDGAFHISWQPSPTPNLAGYLVLYKYEGEDLGLFDHRRFLAADAADLALTVDGLDNDRALLATVVAVDQDQKRSYPAEVVRIMPHAAGTDTSPHITSDPDSAATATYAYTYLPTLQDVNFGTYVWSLDEAPDGMTVDADCGLISWTPTEEQEGPNNVVLRLTKNSDDTLTDSQVFTLHVYPPHQANGLEPHAYNIASSPNADTTDSTDNGSDSKCGDDTSARYEYQVLVHGPTDDLHFELLAGPEGMTIDPATGLISWDVPQGAKGDWVRIRVTAEGQHQLEQDFYLHVRRADHSPGTCIDGDCSPSNKWVNLFGCGTSTPGQSGTPLDLLVLFASAVLIGLLSKLRRKSNSPHKEP